MFNFCPSCASKNISFEEGKVFRCPDCGFVYFHNIASATGCIISVPEADGTEKLMFLVRGKEPCAGMLDLPGGFVDLGEGSIEGLHREIKEELSWQPPIPQGGKLIDAYKLFASFPNVYEYKKIKYNTCDIFYYVRVPGLKEEDLRLEESEISGVHFLKPQEIDFDKIAFGSIKKAVKAYLELKKV